jgi:glyoxylase-like metal-dependent hydrolase (beta-lactamase superfamily II)
MKNDIPNHLSLNHALGVQQGEPIAQFEIGSGKNFVYLILDWSSQSAAMVDPQKDCSEPLQALKQYGFKLETILLTHSHYDHTAGVVPLLKLFPELSVRVGEADQHRLERKVCQAPGFRVIQEGETVRVGRLVLTAHHTPGHSAGEFSYFLPQSDLVSTPYLFTGDTIFIRDCGRTDFEDGSNEAMFQSIQKIKTFPKNTVFLVGHHYAKECSTTLQRELMESPPFQCKTVSELASLP